MAIAIPKPASPAEEAELVARFLSGLKKLLTADNNWTFLQQLRLSLDYCTQCQSCNDSCSIYIASGKNNIYRPTFRSEIFRRIIKKHASHNPLSFLLADPIELNWTVIARLAELSYRCTLCRRCAQACPIGVDNGLIAHELRKLFSQEMGITVKELHQQGTLLQLKSGSSTGMNPEAFRDNMDFIDDDVSERTGIPTHTVWDKKGADILLIHNAGEILSWPDNPGAYSLLFNQAGLNWTMSSEVMGYDAVNYGLWYDDTLFARIQMKQMKVAKSLGVKLVVIGECGHAHKAMAVVGDRLLPIDLRIPRISVLPLLRDLVVSGVYTLDPKKNNFPVTLHDPCNMVRSMGIVQPQREVLAKIAPQFREMSPNGVRNYCCGGGSGFALVSGNNFEQWRTSVAGRLKIKQIVESFQDEPQDINKYVCTPCSNCKGQFRDMFKAYQLWKKSRIGYGGLAELVVNAMVGTKESFIRWEEGIG